MKTHTAIKPHRPFDVPADADMFEDAKPVLPPEGLTAHQRYVWFRENRRDVYGRPLKEDDYTFGGVFTPHGAMNFKGTARHGAAWLGEARRGEAW